MGGLQMNSQPRQGRRILAGGASHRARNEGKIKSRRDDATEAPDGYAGKASAVQAISVASISKRMELFAWENPGSVVPTGLDFIPSVHRWLAPPARIRRP
ncbi:hypothetical protein llg_01750 [Luteolibacter sp. LG18]|nr:hypothetical protein llg_01750 [Luteolibacter sp. LG18]